MATATPYQKISITEIKIKNRSREDMGDLTDLAESIQKVGLLHPVVIDSNHNLIAGSRRIAAFKKLGKSHIPAITCSGLDEALEALLAERDENGCRLPLLPTEMVKLSKKIEAIEKPAAETRMKSGKKIDPTSNSAGGLPGETREKVAAAVGVSHDTLKKATEVVEAAKDDPETCGDLPATMNGTTVNGAHKEMKKRKAKKKAEEKPTEDEKPWVDEWGIPVTKEAAAAFRAQELFDDLLTKLRECKRLYKELADHPGGAFLTRPGISMNTKDAWRHSGLETCILNVKDCRPTYTVCPYTFSKAKNYKHGKDCNLCHGLGWVRPVGKDEVPDELIESAKKEHGVS